VGDCVSWVGFRSLASAQATISAASAQATISAASAQATISSMMWRGCRRGEGGVYILKG